MRKWHSEFKHLKSSRDRWGRKSGVKLAHIEQDSIRELAGHV